MVARCVGHGEPKIVYGQLRPSQSQLIRWLQLHEAKPWAQQDSRKTCRGQRGRTGLRRISAATRHDYYPTSSSSLCLLILLLHRLFLCLLAIPNQSMALLLLLWCYIVNWALEFNNPVQASKGNWWRNCFIVLRTQSAGWPGFILLSPTHWGIF